MTARTLMIQGTASGVGKSFVVTALCRYFALQGVRVVPFKAQNLSNNAAVTSTGGEIGRSQALQARAAYMEPDTRMNPVLVKPLGAARSEVVVLGQGDSTLARTPWSKRRKRLWPIVVQALAELCAEADLVIIEGAGSPAEINLRDADVVNMAVAREVGAPVIVVADIDKGGAFASLYGTWALLEPADRRYVRGFLLNRFRGDIARLTPAPSVLQAKTGVPVLGVIPFVRHDLPEEDAATLSSRGSGSLTIAAVQFPHVANFDDLDPLAAEANTEVRWVDRARSLEGAAAIILPGTRNTVGDLRWLWHTGLAAAIRASAQSGVSVVGLCGGFQMLGHEVADPHGIEAGGRAPGLGLLDLTTTLVNAKRTQVVTARIAARDGLFAQLRGHDVKGYEIHHGETVIGRDTAVWFEVDGRPLGGGRGVVWGGYLHGIFADDMVRSSWLASLGGTSLGGWEDRLEAELDRIASVVASAVDIDTITRLAREGVA